MLSGFGFPERLREDSIVLLERETQTPENQHFNSQKYHSKTRVF